MPLTVMTYNIKTGGDGRLDAVGRVINEQRPDVLALQELRGFHRDGARKMRRLASDTGLHPFLARSLFGQPVAVLVREPAWVTAAGPVMRPFHHAAERVVLNTERGPLTVIGTHLCPSSGRRRKWEARWLAARADPAGMTLLMGDLNTLDPWTDHADRLRRLPARYRSRHLMRRGGDLVDSRAIRVLAAAGLVDLFRSTRADTQAGTTRPTGASGPPVSDSTSEKDYTAPTEHGGGEEFSGMRLDYVMGTRQVAALALDCHVVSGGKAEWASDHYPVVATLDLDARV